MQGCLRFFKRTKKTAKVSTELDDPKESHDRPPTVLSPRPVSPPSPPDSPLFSNHSYGCLSISTKPFPFPEYPEMPWLPPLLTLLLLLPQFKRLGYKKCCNSQVDSEFFDKLVTIGFERFLRAIDLSKEFDSEYLQTFCDPNISMMRNFNSFLNRIFRVLHRFLKSTSSLGTHLNFAANGQTTRINHQGLSESWKSIQLVNDPDLLVTTADQGLEVIDLEKWDFFSFRECTYKLVGFLYKEDERIFSAAATNVKDRFFLSETNSCKLLKEIKPKFLFCFIFLKMPIWRKQ
jgi:hypothetical protein